MSAADELRIAAKTMEARAEVSQQVASWLNAEADAVGALGDEYVDDSALLTARLINGSAA